MEQETPQSTQPIARRVSRRWKWIWGTIGIILLLFLVGGIVCVPIASIVYSRSKGIPFALVSRYYQLAGEYGTAKIGKCLTDNESIYRVSGGYNLGGGIIYYYDISGKLISYTYTSDAIDPRHPPQYLALTDCRWIMEHRQLLPNMSDIIQYVFIRIWYLYVPLGK